VNPVGADNYTGIRRLKYVQTKKKGGKVPHEVVYQDEVRPAQREEP
jgi:hypothetical protein